MTREEARNEMIAMWDWLRKNPGKDKCEYFNHFGRERTWLNDCPACENVKIFTPIDRHGTPNCAKCLVSWPILGGWVTDHCMCENSFYAIWGDLFHWVTKYNEQIATRAATEILKLALAAKP